MKLDLKGPIKKNLDNNIHNISLLLSGGADSALLLHMLCAQIENLEETTIHCLTGFAGDSTTQYIIRGDTPTTFEKQYHQGGRGGLWLNDIAARKIIDITKKKFPKANIVHHVFNYSNEEMYLEDGSLRTDLEYSVEDTGIWFNAKSNSYILDAKKVLFRKNIREYSEENDITYRIDATSCNPPTAVMEELDIYKTRMPDRDYEDVKDTQFEGRSKWCSYVNYHPFIDLNKKELAELYHEYELMDDIYPITESCVQPMLADGSNEPCKECWWCKEKYWAFNTYDFGRV